MSKPRIFTFGCSFTDYSWPTWADIILYGNLGYNLGRSGAGYDYILYRIVEADRKFKFTQDDIIIIVLTQPIRLDILLNDENDLYWITKGNALSHFSDYNDKIFSIDGLLFKSYNNIILMNQYLSSKRLNYIFGSISDLFESPEGINNILLDNILYETNELITYVKQNIEIKLMSFDKYLSVDGKLWDFTKIYEFEKFNDYHPRPRMYFNWINDVLLKCVDIDVKATIEDIENIENAIDDIKYLNELGELIKKYPNFYSHRIYDGYISAKRFI